MTGPAGVLADFAEAFGEIDGILLLVALGVVLVILLIVYRSPVLPFIVLMTSVLALGAASFVIYQLAANDVITLNGQSQGILFILVIGATTDYSLLLVARFREELRRTEYQVDAMRATLRGTLEAILASGGTVILGVMTLVLSELNSNRGLGPVAAVGIAFAMLAALTFLPAVLVMLGRRAFWPVRPKLDLTHPQSQVTGFWARVATTVDRKPRVVLLGSSAVLLGLCAFVPIVQGRGRAPVGLLPGLRGVDRGPGRACPALPGRIGQRDGGRRPAGADRRDDRGDRRQRGRRGRRPPGGRPTRARTRHRWWWTATCCCR